MSKLGYALIIVFSFGTINSFSQDTVYFKNGLIADAPAHYGREAISTDLLAYKLYTNNLQKPVEGGSIVANEQGENIAWQNVIADSLNRLRPQVRPARGRGRSFGGNYIYLTYNAEKEKNALLNIQGNSFVFVNGKLHTGDPYGAGWLYIPVKLKKGVNELYVRGGYQTTARLVFPAKPISINTEDATLPYIVLNENSNALQGAIVILNTSDKDLKGLQIKSELEGNEKVTLLPSIPPLSSRKVSFNFNAANISQKGKYDCKLTLLYNRKILDEQKIFIEAAEPADHYSQTFTSDIDGSLQYYAVAPQSTPVNSNSALFLSVHGAGVEAIGQARAYHSKDWGTLVAATNRRPRGFNWEDWGRLDALEVLNIATNRFPHDPKRIYLTGHSMGGHGAWFLGATYPDKWAAIGACSGYPTLQGYGSADGSIPDSSRSVMEQMLLRSSNQSNVVELAHNYKAFGVYILHGDSDKVVSVKYARQMKKVLSDFHTDFSYYEYPGGEHWFGDQSVDWKPLFDFFKWHQLPDDSMVNSIDFTTASPGISSDYHWVSILQQIHPLQYSNIQLVRNRAKNIIIGTTTNVHLLKFVLSDFPAQSDINIILDSNSIPYTVKNDNDSIVLLRENNQWKPGENVMPSQKNPQRYGTLKDAFNHRMIFVFGTTGSKEENEWNYDKAKYDAETWYYRGNGAVDVIADKEYSRAKYTGRNVIIYGNANTNSTWNVLLADCPIQVKRNEIKVGNESYTGDDLGAYFVWPMKNSSLNSVGVISGTGIKGMNAANANQYFAGASGFPDFMIFRLNMLQSGADSVEMAGFFDNDWKLTKADSVKK